MQGRKQESCPRPGHEFNQARAKFSTGGITRVRTSPRDLPTSLSSRKMLQLLVRMAGPE